MAKSYRNPSDNSPSLQLNDEANGRSIHQHSNELQRNRRLRAIGALGLGALALGALALGALAIGAFAIGSMAVGRARIRRMEIDELTVRNLRITESLKTPPNAGSGFS